ncbi:MAG: PilC/PilY family type IV pilus protein [Steroidobacteraceae bacterium]
MFQLSHIATHAARASYWLQRCAAALLLTLVAGYVSAQSVSTTPLSIGGNVPGNLLLTPSVEFPTMDSMANLNAYDVARTYTGYFDPGKCYRYIKGATTAESHFEPRSLTTTRTCSGAWSGNYMNWAATQTIDPFRKALTGGYRVRDTPTETWLEKAFSDNQSGSAYFPNRNISGSGTISLATPATNWSDFRTRVSRAQNRMYFTRGTSPGLGGETAGLPASTEYDPATNPLDSNADNAVYWVTVRVKVCDTTVGVESNCVQYGSGWKPEGLIQKYANKIRYSAFGYLNDDNGARDGAALRARQKFVGDEKLDPTAGWISNPNREWNPTTGVFYQNPDATDAAATPLTGNFSIVNSGVINYVNKFGQATMWDSWKSTKATHKSYDPVGELYYTAIRYLKHQGNVSTYTSLAGNNQSGYNQADGFPVITNWDDPLQYSCQNNAILGIGDVYSHLDKNLPGDASTANEPAKPAAVANDTTVNARTALAKVFQLQGLALDAGAAQFQTDYNGAHIAGLAYDSHTKDIRPDLDDKQTVSTYWVDVRENQTLEGPARNQYWLATKFGGFEVPDDYDPYARVDPLPTSWWTSGEVLSNGQQRPENFYVASEADKMVESLTRAFAKIAAEASGSASSLAANSTRLDTDTRTFQAQFFSGSWRGELNAYTVALDGTLSSGPVWRASSVLAGTTWSSRDIRVNAGGTLRAFTFDNLTGAQQTALGSLDVVDYLRGNRTKEEAQSGGTLRTRTGILGDIVNSTPVYVGAPNGRLYAGATFSGASAYATFAAGAASTRTQVVYVGSNDGMLHAFNSTTGAEIFAFVPSASIAGGLVQYSNPDYEHRYFVDGEVTAADVYDTTTSSWKTVLVGTMGRGGPGVFALDVTNPAAPALLWEKTAAEVPALGKNIGRPVIAQVANGDWRVLVGNGPGSTASPGAVARLVMIGLTGAGVGTTTVVTPPETSTVNGMTAVLARDSNADGFTDTAYAGDLRGNLWKISNLATTPTSLLLYQARDASNNVQPITAAPLVGRHPTTAQLWVFFGTGQYLNENDLTNSAVQTWYGIKDNSATIGGRGNLVDRDITVETTLAGSKVRVIEAGNASELDTTYGWYIDLVSPVSGVEGERMVVPNRFQGSALVGTTRIPEQGDPCAPGGRGFIMAIDPFTGARLTSTFFDVSGDSLFNNSDMLCDANGCTPVSGLGFESSPNNPIFIEDVMQVGLDDGTTRTIRTQGSSVQATRMSWRELFQ